MNVTAIRFFLFLFIFSYSIDSLADEPFDIGTLRIAIEHVDDMVVGDFVDNNSPDVLLLGRASDKTKQLQLITLDKGKAAKLQIGLVPLDEGVLAFDVAHLAGSDKQALVFLLADRLVRFDVSSKKLLPLLEIQSLYRDSRRRTSFINRLKFLVDVNNDGLSDVVLPDFSKTRVYLQQSDGGFGSPQVLDMPAEMRLFHDNSAVYQGSPMFQADYNFDGEKDLIFRVDSQLRVFYQHKGQFDSKASDYPLKLAQPLSDDYNDLNVDHSHMLTHSFYRLKDLNDDGIPDLVTQLTKSAGLLDKSSQYQIYFGAKTPKGVVGYPPQPQSVIASEGLQFELSMVDFDGDKKLDLISPSYKLGLGSIIASLFSSSADLDIAFHSLNKQGIYHSKPNLERELTVDFDLSSGQEVFPLMKVKDFDGDGIADLLMGNGSKRIYLYRGIRSDKLFERRPDKIRIKLPRDGRLVEARDLNLDGKTDLLIHYDKLDGKQLYKEMKILLSK